MNTKYYLWAALLFCITANAQFVPSEQAKQKGLEFLNTLSSVKTRGAISSEKLALSHVEYEADNSTPTLYIFNSDQSYVVVSADERACDIIGYSDEGIFDPDNIPSALKVLLEQFSNEIGYARKNNLSKFVKTRGTEDNRKEIAPMLTSKWGQGAPYNNKCPIDKQTKERCVAGCVPVAMAQLMYYFKWPDIGRGSYSYYWDRGEQELSADFGSQYYHMENMKDEYKETEVDDNLSTLLYHCGVAAGAQFSSSETAGGKIGLHMAKFFKYSDNYWELPDYFDKEEVLNEVHTELSRNHPMLTTLLNKNGYSAHLVVCDGYKKDGYLHYSFGWNGVSDGFYHISIINTSTGSSYYRMTFEMGYIPKNGEIEVDGFIYEIYEDEAYLVSGKASGDYIMPTEISYQGKKYKVLNLCHEAFRDNKELTSVTIPNGIRVVSDSVFVGCTSIKELIIEDGDKPLYWSWFNGFKNMSQLDKVYIGRDINGTDWMEVKDLVIGPCVRRLGYIYGQFQKITMLCETPPRIDEKTNDQLIRNNTPVYVPIGTIELYQSSDYWKGVRLIEMPFEQDGITYAKESNDGVTILNGDVNSTEFVIPEEINYNGTTLKVSKIGDQAFMDNQTITSLSIPSTVEYIGKEAFRNASKLQFVEIKDGDSILVADNNIFKDTKLSKAYIGRSWEGRLFSSNYNLKDVTLSDHVKSIPNYAFRNVGLEYLYIPASVEKIGYQVFYHWALKDLEISPDNNYFSYKDRTLYSKDQKKIIEYLAVDVDYTMPNEVTEVGDYAFAYDALRSIKLSENIESIGSNAFCEALNSSKSSQDTLYLPKTLKVIADNPFSGLNVKAFDIDADNPYFATVNGILFNKSGNALISMPSAIDGTIVITEGVDTIGAESFAESKALTVYIPSTTKYMGDKAFYYSNIDSLIINCSEPPECNNISWNGPFESWGYRKFNPETGDWIWESESKSFIYVPEGTLSIYQEANVFWKISNRIRELSAEEMSKWYTTDIKMPQTDNRHYDAIYDLKGCKVKKPNKGIYILRKSDGSSQKVIY